MADLFFYGTLCHRPLLRLVLGAGRADLSAIPARLAGYRAVWAAGRSFPLILPAKGDAAEGLLARDLTEADLARLDFYEGGFGYRLTDVEVATEDGLAPARVYLPDPGLWQPGAPWDLADWVARWGALTLRAAAEIMDHFGQVTADEIARRDPTIRMRAASWLRAQGPAPPQALRKGLGAQDVTETARRRRYTNYFALEERDVRFRQFDGSMSPTVERAAFVAADAVTVLPYDPVRDRVLVVEQFRAGPYMRGDRFPWTLEPIAGRIDAGETPDATAHREAWEESRLTFDRLIPIGSYYPTAGAVTEYLYSYIGLADLPDTAGGVAGEIAEAEDIRSHVLPFETLMEALDSGEADTAPLILSALWLAARRPALIAGAAS